MRRDVTRAACAELGLTPWDDPHNADPRFTRVRLRAEVLPLLEEVLGGGEIRIDRVAVAEETDPPAHGVGIAVREVRSAGTLPEGRVPLVLLHGTRPDGISEFDLNVPNGSISACCASENAARR